jgi:hypothetical protein
MWLTLYQCFFTLPSVRCGKDFPVLVKILIFIILQTSSQRTFAISLQLFPASLMCFSRNSSAGVQGVFVRPFFAGGGPLPSAWVGAGCPVASAKLELVGMGAGAIGLGVICVG